jgi:hypothetical protein
MENHKRVRGLGHGIERLFQQYFSYTVFHFEQFYLAEETGVTGENNYKSMLYRVHIAMSGIHG